MGAGWSRKRGHLESSGSMEHRGLLWRKLPFPLNGIGACGERKRTRLPHPRSSEANAEVRCEIQLTKGEETSLPAHSPRPAPRPQEQAGCTGHPRSSGQAGAEASAASAEKKGREAVSTQGLPGHITRHGGGQGTVSRREVAQTEKGVASVQDCGGLQEGLYFLRQTPSGPSTSAAQDGGTEGG